MYEYLKGTITKITSSYLVVEVRGVGYLLHVANPYRFSHQVGEERTIYVHQVVREDAQTLYGFQTEDEKTLFLQLISVSGIGPTSALAVIAADDHSGLIRAIEEKNSAYLIKFPKIGKKTAQQMILDLEGKMLPIQAGIKKSSQPSLATVNQELDEAIEALLSLGYKASELKKVRSLLDGRQETAEQYIKSALKLLVK